jgi:hypothetical protein
MDEESTGGIVFLPEITSSFYEASTGGMGFCRELPAHRWGIHPRKGILPGITLTRIQTAKIKMLGKSSEQLKFKYKNIRPYYELHVFQRK